MKKRRGDKGNPGTDGKGWNKWLSMARSRKDDIESFSEYLRALPGGRYK